MAGKAQRDVWMRAGGQDSPLSRAEWRVLGAVVCVLSSWSKVGDYATLQQIAEQCGRRSKRRVADALRSLRDRGLIEYEPGRGRGPTGGYPSWLALAASDGSEPDAAEGPGGSDNVVELGAGCADPLHGQLVDDEGMPEPCPTCGEA